MSYPYSYPYYGSYYTPTPMYTQQQQMYPVNYYNYPMIGYPSTMNNNSNYYYNPGYYGGIPYKPSTLRTIYNRIRHGSTYANYYNQAYPQQMMYDYGRYRGNWLDYSNNNQQ